MGVGGSVHFPISKDTKNGYILFLKTVRDIEIVMKMKYSIINLYICYARKGRGEGGAGGFVYEL